MTYWAQFLLKKLTSMSMNNCRVTLIPLEGKKEHQPGYSLQGIKYLVGKTDVNLQLPFTRREFVTEQPKKQKGMSISGYQPKLSLRIVNNQFKVVETFGTYILKPSPEEYPYLAENEHAIMSVMRNLKFEVPPFGLVPFQEETDSGKIEYAFIIKRYDRNEEDQSKVHQEQLDGAMGVNEKYGKIDNIQTVSYETVCQFLIESIDTSLPFKRELFKRIMYAYLLGNNDLHLRNFGIVMPSEEKNKIAPIYDFVSTAPYVGTFSDCYMALPLLKIEENDDDLAFGFNTKHGQYIGYDFIEFGKGIGLNSKLSIKIISDAVKKKNIVIDTIKSSFMSEEHQKEIIHCFNQRLNCLEVQNYNPI
ncbi:MAG: serine/threonine-protein kinase HipA [Colwellia sp.]|jgi:serine/threonine-protein kinase HipA